MTLLEKLQGSYIHRRRVTILARELSTLLPAKAAVLDVSARPAGIACAEVEVKTAPLSRSGALDRRACPALYRSTVGGRLLNKRK